MPVNIPQPAADASAAHGRRRPLRVLVVDDEPLIRWAVREMLTAQGYIVSTADTGASALRELADAYGAIDVVLLDYRLPDGEGLDLLAKLRRLSPRSTVIMMTAHGTPEMRAGALALGACGIVDKPFNVHDIPVLIEDAYPSRVA